MSGNLDLWIVKFTAGGTFKVSGGAGEHWACSVPGLECSDYCLMKKGALPGTGFAFSLAWCCQMLLMHHSC